MKVATSHGRKLLSALKTAAGMPGPRLLIPLADRSGTCLRVLATSEGRQAPTDIRFLTEWRNKNVESFLTEFDASTAQTSRWLAETVAPNDGKIIFMVDDAEGVPFAHMGLDSIDWGAATGEADAIVRGGPAPRGTMTSAVRTMIAWARGSLGLKRIGVRVRSDNSAVDFYKKVGFVEQRRVALRLEVEPGTRRWIESSDTRDPSLAVIYMEYGVPGLEPA